MSTATKTRPAGKRHGGNQRESFGAQIREGWYAAKDALQTRNGRFLLTVVQFLLSFVNLFYLKGVVQMAYNSMFYRLEVPDDERKTFCVLVSLVCLGFGLLMFFTRRQIVTRLVIMCSMPFYLPIVMFNYQLLELLIPLGIMVVVTYLVSGTSEGPKTIFGAVFIMIYILGAFVFLTVQSLLKPDIRETVTRREVSPNGQYRYSVVQVEDRADGNTYVAIEPNTRDMDYKHSKWYAKGFVKEIYRERPLDTFECEWKTQTRAEITRELITNNPNTTFILNSEQMKLLGLDIGYAEEFTLADLSSRQRHKLGYGLETNPIDARFSTLMGITLMEKDFSVTLTFDQMVELGMNPTYEQRLSRMTDENLAKLGVPEENEVLMVNGKVVFRQYVAELERTFWDSSRSMSAFLEPNTLPEVNPEGLDLDTIRKEREERIAAKEAATGKTKPVTEATTETTETTTTTTVS